MQISSVDVVTIIYFLSSPTHLVAPSIISTFYIRFVRDLSMFMAQWAEPQGIQLASSSTVYTFFTNNVQFLNCSVKVKFTRKVY